MSIVLKSILHATSYVTIFVAISVLLFVIISVIISLTLFRYAACEQGHFDVVQILLENGYPVNEEHAWILLDPPQKLNENDVRKTHTDFACV